MAYSTPALVRKALVPTSDGSLPTTPTNTAADLTDAQLADAIAEADSIIDGYIGGYYAVPVDTSNGVPSPLTFWSRNLAAYHASLAYRGSMDFSETDPVARRFKDTMDALSAVASGRMRLQLPQNTGPNSATEAGQVFNPYVGDLFTPDDFSLSTDPNPGPLGHPFWEGWQ